MKQSMILALALALPVMAGDEKSSPITVVEVPVAAPAPACSAFGVEVGAVYTAALNDVLPGVDGMSSWGVDVTGVYDISPNWAATVRMGWSAGSDYYPETDEFVASKVEVETWTITAGLRYSAPITEKLCWYAGSEIGMAYVRYEESDPNGHWSDDYEGWGFAYGVEAGLRYNITPCMYVYSAVHYSGHFAEAELAPGYETSAQSGYGVRMGIGGKF